MNQLTHLTSCLKRTVQQLAAMTALGCLGGLGAISPANAATCNTIAAPLVSGVQYGPGNCSGYVPAWEKATCQYTWSDTRSWDAACNTDTTPAAGDNAVINANHLITLDANATVGALTIQGGANGDAGLFFSNGSTTYNLTVKGNFTNNNLPEWNCAHWVGANTHSCGPLCADTCDGRGWTIFNGTSQQTIGGSSTTTFTNLEINNPAGVKLLADTIVTGQLKLTSGFIDVNGYTLKIYSDCATYPILGNGYVTDNADAIGGIAWLQLNFKSSATETCVFPVYDADGQTYITITKHGSNTGTLMAGASAVIPLLGAGIQSSIDLANNANHLWTLAPGASGETYWNVASPNPTTNIVSQVTVSGLSTATTYDVKFQFCAIPGNCNTTEKNGAGSANVPYFVMVQNKTRSNGAGFWTKYSTPVVDANTSTVYQTGLSGGYGWFNVGVDNLKRFAGVYGGIKLNWKQLGDSGCGTACAKTAAASVLWLGHGVGTSQPQATHWYGVTADPGDTWTVTGLGNNIYTLASAINGKCIAKDTVGSYLLMTACNAGDAAQQWQIIEFNPSGATGGVSFVNPATGNYAHLVPTAGTQETYVDGVGNNWKGVFFLTAATPPDHFRFEFDKNAFLTCQPVNMTVKACRYPTATEPGCTTLYPSGITLTLGATNSATWNGTTTAPTRTFISSDPVTLQDSTAEATTLSYSSTSVIPTNATLECYDTSTSAAVSCTQTFASCSSYFDAVETTTPVSVKGSNLYTKLAGVGFSFDVVGPPAYTSTVTVDLVDASDAPWDCTSGAPTTLSNVSFSAPSVVINAPITASLSTIDGTTLTRRNTFTAQYANAAKKVRVRILDGIGNCYHSTDHFSIRPTSLSLTTDAVDTATHVAVAGSAGSTAISGSLGITIAATALNNSSAVATAYIGTPQLNSANSITDWTGGAITALPNPATSPPRLTDDRAHSLLELEQRIRRG